MASDVSAVSFSPELGLQRVSEPGSPGKLRESSWNGMELSSGSPVFPKAARHYTASSPSGFQDLRPRLATYCSAAPQEGCWCEPDHCFAPQASCPWCQGHIFYGRWCESWKSVSAKARRARDGGRYSLIWGGSPKLKREVEDTFPGIQASRLLDRTAPALPARFVHNTGVVRQAELWRARLPVVRGSSDMN